MRAKTETVFNLVGVDPYEVFHIAELPGIYYRMLECYTVQKYQASNDSWVKTDITIRDFLFKRLNIEKIETRPNRDGIAISYALTFGLNWIAKNKDGQCYGFVEKPYKIPDEWHNTGQKYNLWLNISFLSWDDKEPLYIGGLRK